MHNEGFCLQEVVSKHCGESLVGNVKLLGVTCTSLQDLGSDSAVSHSSSELGMLKRTRYV